MEKARKFLTEYLYGGFIILGLLLYFKECWLTGVWKYGRGNDFVYPIFKRNILIWISLLISLISYFILAVFRKKTSYEISAIHVLVFITYLVVSTLWLNFIYSILNICLLLSNLIYVVHLHLKSKELPNEDILDV